MPAAAISSAVSIWRGGFIFLSTSKVMGLKGTYYHYCGVDRDTMQQFLGADSMGRFLNEIIKPNNDCRIVGVPK